MPNKNLVHYSASSRNSNNEILEKIKKIDTEKEINRGYFHIARGVLQRIGARPNNKEFSTLLGSCIERSNLITVKEWIFEQNPNLESFGKEEIECFTSELRSILSEYFDC